ncbi:MAG: ribbon-helix-helix domain-containing protein [Acidobacteriota bacterium]|nr:ribbon-helix-helix domain-containing protein [Acidobacteriota bacterium]
MSIRTTVTLDEDVVERLKQESKERGGSFKETLNDLLRLALSIEKAQLARKPFKVRPFHSMGIIPGLNYDKISELLDYAEGEDRKW